MAMVVVWPKLGEVGIERRGTAHEPLSARIVEKPDVEIAHNAVREYQTKIRRRELLRARPVPWCAQLPAIKYAGHELSRSLANISVCRQAYDLRKPTVIPAPRLTVTVDSNVVYVRVVARF